jgi:KaiC/GvpD/RAD55 family RecA-like ATPase
MDRGTYAALHRTNLPEADSMRTDGRIDDLVRAFKVLPEATQREYSLTVGEVKYGLDQTTILHENLVSKTRRTLI